jgi:response regulator RpfG family c-di-GMP phosphodiesterase
MTGRAAEGKGARLTGKILAVFEQLGKNLQTKSEPEMKAMTIQLTREIVAEANRASAHEERELVINALLDAVLIFDPETYRHQERVADRTWEMSPIIGLGKREQRILFLASLLHDVGKVGIPQPLLNMPGPYGTLGVGIKKYHLYFALWFLGEIRWLKGIVKAMEMMHYFDKYYPEGLEWNRDESLSTHALSAVDVGDAMQNRDYRPRATLAEVFEEIENQVPVRIVSSPASNGKCGSGDKRIVTRTVRSYDPKVIAALKQVTGYKKPVEPR